MCWHTFMLWQNPNMGRRANTQPGLELYAHRVAVGGTYDVSDYMSAFLLANGCIMELSTMADDDNSTVKVKHNSTFLVTCKVIVGV